MDTQKFQELVDIVFNSTISPLPPRHIFLGGKDDWHCRARLAHFLAMPSIGHKADAIELFKTVVDEEPDLDNAEDVEEKIFALQVLSSCMRPEKKLGFPPDIAALDESLRYINLAIELAEETDFLYKYILRGELWADRWNILHRLGRTDEAKEEADARIAAFEDINFEDINVLHNSYLYFAYRFKARLAAENDTLLIAKDFMHKALEYIEIKDEYKKGIDAAFAATHRNISWILNEIDAATPPTEKCHWDI